MQELKLTKSDIRSKLDGISQLSSWPQGRRRNNCNYIWIKVVTGYFRSFLRTFNLVWFLLVNDVLSDRLSFEFATARTYAGAFRTVTAQLLWVVLNWIIKNISKIFRILSRYNYSRTIQVTSGAKTTPTCFGKKEKQKRHSFYYVLDNFNRAYLCFYPLFPTTLVRKPSSTDVLVFFTNGNQIFSIGFLWLTLTDYSAYRLAWSVRYHRICVDLWPK